MGVLLLVPIQFCMENTAELLKQAAKLKAITLVQSRWRQMRGTDLSPELAAVDRDFREQLRAAAGLSLRRQLPAQMQDEDTPVLAESTEPAEVVQPANPDATAEPVADNMPGPGHEAHMPTGAEDTDLIQVAYC